jgi:hypothetical protein
VQQFEEIYWAPVEEMTPIPHNEPVLGASDGCNRDNDSFTASGAGGDDGNASYSAC